jgi:hypothetical protein
MNLSAGLSVGAQTVRGDGTYSEETSGQIELPFVKNQNSARESDLTQGRLAASKTYNRVDAFGLKDCGRHVV